MRCEHLSLTNFRNYARLELDLQPGATILQGDNAQGKTNFLDALHIIATTRSARRAPEREWINWLALESPLPFLRIVAKVRRAASTVQLEMTAALDENGNGITKRMKINGAPRRAVDMIGQMTVVFFSPGDIELVAGSPAQRRRYLDIMNSQVDAAYLRSLQLYNRVLLQRNSLLRLIRDRQAKPDQLPYWDQRLAELGAYVVDRRRESVEALNVLAGEIHPALTNQHEVLHISYRPNFGGKPSEPLPPLADLPHCLLKAIHAARASEIARGVSLVGPHRDDLQFTTNGADTAAYGSRGQQRTAALALKLAESEYIRERTGELPLLLLDDVMSELDARRRHHLLRSIQPAQQVIITATDLEDFSPDFLSRSTILRVKAGRIEVAR
ncbi:MAG: DNA replication/repair protein RecF [Chloroflexota bacterium]|nr:DNA replication/repair protein RecF [Dehalococcoidia bacterium]MDW8253799.1 DNA replication/repair protein RecF [Chloroflexota bacterium]